MKRDLRYALKEKLSAQELAQVYKSYDVIGDIAIIRTPQKLLKHNKTIAAALMKQHKHVKSVWRQSGPVHGDFRLRTLEWLLGERNTETIHKEHGALFKVDVERCYFSPRLGFERMRVANLVEDDDVIVNMFAGVGCYSILIAKLSHASKIYSIDVNPFAVGYMRENILLNKVVNRVIALEGDAQHFAKKELRNAADRVLMPLPEKASQYIESALSLLKPEGGWIHYYSFEHAGKRENPAKKAESKAAEVVEQFGINFTLRSSRVVRQTGPNWYQIAVDILVNQ